MSKIKMESQSVRPRELIRQDPRSSLVSKFANYTGVAAPALDSYNQYLDSFKELINNTILTLKDGGQITFSDAQIMHPTMLEINQQSEPLYPNHCRSHDLDYLARVFATGHWQGQSKELFLGRIPVMLGSKVCNLSQLRQDELRAVGECPNDPLGYFLIGGSEKVIVMQERAAPNKVLSYWDPEDQTQVLTEIKATAPDGRKVKVSVRAMEHEDDDLSEGKRVKTNHTVLKLQLPFFGKAEINVYALFEILASLDSDKRYRAHFSHPDNILSYIADWVEGIENKKDVAFYLNQTAEAYSAYAGRALDYLAEKLRAENQKRPGVDDPKQFRKELKQRIFADLFANMVNDSIYHRLEMLSHLVARHVEVVLGLRGRKISPHLTNGVRDPRLLIAAGLDDRNDYGNKIIDSPGSLMMFLTSMAWRKQMSEAVLALDKHNQPNPLQELDTTMPRKILTDILAKAIRSGNWGIPGSAIHSGITRALQRASMVGTIADLRSVNAPIPRESKDAEPRSVHITSWGFICPTSTKEGEDCGLAKALAQGSLLSLRRDPTPIEDFLGLDSRFNIDPDAFDKNVRGRVFLNGRYLGWTDVEQLRREFLLARRTGNGGARAIPKDVSFYRDLDGDWQIDSNENRLIRPVLVVDIETQELVVDQLGLWGTDWASLELNGAVEFLDSNEQGNALIATKPEQLRVPIQGPDPRFAATYGELRDPEVQHVPIYTHVELDPQLILSYEASVAPFPGNAPGPRITYESNMAKHAVGIYHANHATRFEGAKVIAYPQRPLVYTDVYTRSGNSDYLDRPEVIERLAQTTAELDDEQVTELKQRLVDATSADLFGATGQNAIVAIALGGWNEEDAMIINQRFVDLGGFMSTTYKVESYEVENPDVEKIGIPPNLSEAQKEFFAAIDPATGTPKPGTVLRPGQALLAKYIEDNGRISNTSIYLKSVDTITPAEALKPVTIRRSDESDAEYAARQAEIALRPPRAVLSSSISNEPIFDSYLRGRNGAGRTFVKLKYRITRRPQVGDKFASRFSQKGVAGLIRPPEDMPFNQEGISPDIIMNPHSYPTRMTIGQLIEALTAKAGVMVGHRLNGTAFREVNEDELRAVLNEFGYSSLGGEMLVDGMTGEPFEALIFQGPVFYQVLKHMVEDKKHGRARGDVHHLYRQPPEGRAREGGLRLGKSILPQSNAQGWASPRVCGLCSQIAGNTAAA